MNRSWVRFPQAAQIRPPGSGWAFFMRACCLWSHGCCGRRRARLWGRAARCARGRRPARVPAGVPAAAWLALMGRAAVCAGGRRPAREIATREPAARSGRSRGPPWPCRRPPAPRPGPAFCSSPVPSGPSGALHTSGAGSLMCALRVDSLSGRAPLHSGAARPCNLRRSRRPHSTFRTGGDGGFAALGGGWRRVAGVSHP